MVWRGRPSWLLRQFQERGADTGANSLLDFAFAFRLDEEEEEEEEDEAGPT